jgi:thiol-disulfide isomerase/thioredoxin
MSGRYVARRAVLGGVLGAIASAAARPLPASALSDGPPPFGSARHQFTILRPARLVPPVQLTRLDGSAVSFASFRGKVVLVNFWATWCPACRLDLPTLASLAGSRPDRLDIVAICTDTRDLRKTRAFLGGLAVQNLACYVDAYGAAAEASSATFSLVGMPITYLVGTSNRVEGYITGAAEWLSPAGARLLQFYREQG